MLASSILFGVNDFPTHKPDEKGTVELNFSPNNPLKRKLL